MVDLDAVYREHSAAVYRFLLAKTGSPQLAEELTQETFYQAVKSIDRFDGSCQITTFLFGIAKNVWYNAYRKKQKEPEPLTKAESIGVASAENDVLASMGREEILVAVHRMPEPGREVLYLRLLGSLSFAEIGAILGKTENWARVTFYRAKQHLIKEMKQE
jgi:RNA polymerase sigma-70 factor (ECF subfamily)